MNISKIKVGNTTYDLKDPNAISISTVSTWAQAGNSDTIPSSKLPSYVDDVLEYESTSSFPETGESGKIYVATDTNKTYRWGGSSYVVISETLAVGTTEGTAYDGAAGAALKSKLDGIEAGAQTHRAPSAAEVKTALGTGSGTTKYLREDGTWATPPNTDTWRGVLDNLTSDSTSDSLSAAQGKSLANGSARDNTKLPLAGGTMSGTINNIGNVGGNIGGRDAIRTNAGDASDFIIGHSGSNYNNARTLLYDQRYIHLHPCVRIGSYATATTPSHTLDIDGTFYASSNSSVGGTFTAASFIKSGGTSAQFLKADGSVDSNTYVTTSDSRLSDSRPASDVSSWAKASSKPSYTASEVGALSAKGGGIDGTITLSTTESAIVYEKSGTNWIRAPFRFKNDDYNAGIAMMNGQNNTNVYNKLGFFSDKYGQGNESNCIFLYPSTGPKVGGNPIWHSGNVTASMITTALGYTPFSTEGGVIGNSTDALYRYIRVTRGSYGTAEICVNTVGGGGTYIGYRNANETGNIVIQPTQVLFNGTALVKTDDSRLSNSRPASDVYSWAKASSKPSYGYGEISYGVNTVTTSGAISLAGTTPLHIVTLNGNASSVALSSNPAAGHSCHVIFFSTAARTVVIAHDATARVCPGAANVTLNVPANGYAEVDFLYDGSKTWVRGV